MDRTDGYLLAEKLLFHKNNNKKENILMLEGKAVFTPLLEMCPVIDSVSCGRTSTITMTS